MKFPHAFQKHRAGDDLSGVAQKIFQKLKFARLQVDRIAPTRDRALQQVHLKIGGFQNGDLIADMRPAGEGVHARVQFRKGIGLDQIVVAAGLQPFDTVVDAAHCRQEQNRREDLRATQGFDECEPVHLGKHAVHNEDIVIAAGRKVQAFAAIDGVIDLVTVFLKATLRERGGLSIVFDKQ